MKAFLLLIIFAVSTKGIVFHCNYAVVNWLYVNDLYQCGATVEFSGSATTLEDVTGSHLDGYNNNNVRALVVDSQNVPSIPKGITEPGLLPNIIAVQWYISNLRSISADDLEQFPLLQILSIYQNSITTLDGNLFMHSRFLKSIGFYNNLIRYVGSDLLTSLNDLQVVNLQLNPCVNTRADTPLAISILNRDLPTMCAMPIVTEPPIESTTTTVESTTVTDPPTTTESTTETEPMSDCSEELEEIKRLRAEIAAQSEFIDYLQALCMLNITTN